ncbi:ankyrin repeat domain-containing protein [Streptomyces sp. NPDC088788]|uniref:ankyrin repeat domain-containing protein n=1 Tax=Streptomyces sp. NPDC088788 TaxID=3365898 RepID=UPI003818E397
MENTCTPAHQAVESEDADLLTQLLANGLDPDEVCHDMTLLAHAVDVESDGPLQQGTAMTVHLVELLLASGADPRLPGTDGQTPIGIARHYGHDKAVELLQQHIDEKPDNRPGQMCF